MNSQERFRVGAFAGGSAAELPSLEEELAQVFLKLNTESEFERVIY